MFHNKVTNVFFDLDHTLWDFDKNSANTFQKIFNEQNIDIELHDFLAVYVPANLKFWRLFREEKITKAELRYQRLKSVFDELDYRLLMRSFIYYPKNTLITCLHLMLCFLILLRY